MEKWNIGFGVFYFPSGVSTQLSPSQEYLSIPLTIDFHDTLQIPLNAHLLAYPHLEIPFQILKSLLCLPNRQNVLRFFF
jgi:hypothetical protein